MSADEFEKNLSQPLKTLSNCFLIYKGDKYEIKENNCVSA